LKGVRIGSFYDICLCFLKFSYPTFTHRDSKPLVITAIYHAKWQIISSITLTVEMPRSSRVAVAAIDFGTTNTGVGYYLRAENEDLAAQNIKLLPPVSVSILSRIIIISLSKGNKTTIM